MLALGGFSVGMILIQTHLAALQAENAETNGQVSITTPSGEVKTQECLTGADIVVQAEEWGS